MLPVPGGRTEPVMHFLLERRTTSAGSGNSPRSPVSVIHTSTAVRNRTSVSQCSGTLESARFLISKGSFFVSYSSSSKSRCHQRQHRALQLTVRMQLPREGHHEEALLAVAVEPR